MARFSGSGTRNGAPAGRVRTMFYNVKHGRCPEQHSQAEGPYGATHLMAAPTDEAARHDA